MFLKNKDKYFFLAIFFLILQIIVLYFNLKSNEYLTFFWFCNHSPIIFAVAFYFRKIDIVKSLINIGFIIQFFWLLDFLSKFFFNYYIFESTKYVFENESRIILLVPVLIHIFTTNVALFFTYKEKNSPKIYYYSGLYLIVLYGITLLFTKPIDNINCVYYICSLENLTPNFYTYLWPLIVFVLLVIPTTKFQELLYKLSKKN